MIATSLSNMNTRNILAAAAIILLSGCASLPESAAVSEGVWQGLNAADFSQTVTIAREPRRYSECAELTQPIIGSHPSQQGVEAYWAGYSLLHYAISGWLAREADATGERGWIWALYGWEAVTLASSARNVVHNESIGLTLFGPREKPRMICVNANASGCLRWLPETFASSG